MTDTLSSSEGRINAMTVYARPCAEGSSLTVQSRYYNYIGGEWVAPPPADTSRMRAPPFPAERRHIHRTDVTHIHVWFYSRHRLVANAPEEEFEAIERTDTELDGD
jgi:hypothetical protein